MRPPMVPNPTNPTTTLSLDIASPSLRFSDFRSAWYRLARAAHIAEGQPAQKARCAMASVITAASTLNSARSTSFAWLRCRRAALLLDELAARFPRRKGACTGADFGGLSDRRGSQGLRKYTAPALSLPRAQCDERIEYQPVDLQALVECALATAKCPLRRDADVVDRAAVASP